MIKTAIVDDERVSRERILQFIEIIFLLLRYGSYFIQLQYF